MVAVQIIGTVKREEEVMVLKDDKTTSSSIVTYLCDVIRKGEGDGIKMGRWLEGGSRDGSTTFSVCENDQVR